VELFSSHAILNLELPRTLQLQLIFFWSKP